MRLVSNNAIYLVIRWAALLGGAAVCAGVLVHDGARLPWPDITVLTAAAAWLQRRAIVLRRAPDGTPELTHSLGNAICVAVLLRDGPAAALVVCLFAQFLHSAECWLALKHRSATAGRSTLLALVSGLFYLPALQWCGGRLYLDFGGQHILSPADSERFFQDPLAVLLPLLGMLIVTDALGFRLYTAVLMICKGRRTQVRALLDPMLSVMLCLEGLVGALLLVLWSAWGWATGPYLLLITEALLLSARSYFERLDVQRSAECDPLTGLASWRGMDSFLRQRLRLTRARHAPLALLFIDADGLKQVNDRYGHTAGDELLKLIGDTCRLHTRERDLVGRRGGDEFLVALEGVDRPEAEKMVGRLQQAFADAVAVHPLFSQTPAGISVGLAMFPTDAQNIQTLIETADREMYKDKQTRKAVPVAA